MKKQDVSKTARASLSEQKCEEAKALSPLMARIRIPTKRPSSTPPLTNKKSPLQATKKGSSEVACTDIVSSHLPNHPESSGNPISKRVHRWHSKKTATVLKKIGEAHEAKDRKLGEKISIVSETTPEQQLQSEQDELWRDMMKPHEERNFQISRITNFFS